MPTAVIVDAIRAPSGKGKPGGALSSIHPADLLSRVLRELTVRSGLDPALIDDVIAGCVSQAGEQSFNIGRNAVLGAGFPESVPATTVDRQCGSSQQAVHFAAQSVLAGAYDIVIACGVESMSRVQMDSPAAGKDAAGPAVAARYPAGRDETAYEKAEVIDFHRGHVKHQAFGGGVHRCLGSHLARTELIVGLEAVLDMIPEYHIDQSYPHPFEGMDRSQKGRGIPRILQRCAWVGTRPRPAELPCSSRVLDGLR